MVIRILSEPKRIGEEAYGEFSVIMKKVAQKSNHLGMVSRQGKDLCPKLQNQSRVDFRKFLLSSIK